MQNVLVDDRRIWVDLCVTLYIRFQSSHFFNLTRHTAPSPLRVLTMYGPTTPLSVRGWARARAEVEVLGGGMTLKPRGGTETAQQTNTTNMIWCSTFPRGIATGSEALAVGVRDVTDQERRIGALDRHTAETEDTIAVRGVGAAREIDVRGNGMKEGTNLSMLVSSSRQIHFHFILEFRVESSVSSKFGITICQPRNVKKGGMLKTDLVCSPSLSRIPAVLCVCCAYWEQPFIPL